MSTDPIRWDRRDDGIVVITFDDPTQQVNTISARFQDAFHAVVDRLVAERDEITGVVLASAKKTWVVGADLVEFRESMERGESLGEALDGFKADLRRLETLGRPVVAAINGTALGGGFEIALACHHRIAVDDPSVRIGLPEVKLGLLPAGGGVTRLVRLLGLQAALTEHLLIGAEHRVAAAKEKGLVDEVVPDAEALMPAAIAWIGAHPDAVARWDAPGYKMPGGTPSNPKLAMILPSFGANLLKQTNGAPAPGPRAILSAAVEGAQVDLETASAIETRYMESLLRGATARNMLQAFFFDLQYCKGGGGRPVRADGTPYPERRPTKVAVIGAGMMGAGIAYVTARAGIDVVLKDVDHAAAEKGLAHCRSIEEKKVARGRTTQEKADALLARIHPTGDVADLAGCDLVVEAVFESPELKDKVFRELEPVVAPDALLGSNTSTLPITGLATSVQRPEAFIGLHFFSPVEKMPLLEIIRGEKTDDETLARALDYAAAIRMTPIIVNDSRGFYTSRVFGRYITEALTMLSEGIAPAVVEQAGRRAGYPAPPLQLMDELNLKTVQRIMHESARAEEPGMATPPEALRLIDAMVDELQRPGRQAGAGFYEYVDGKRAGLWPGLREHVPAGPTPGVLEPAPDLQELADRFLFLQAIETQRRVDEGVIQSDAEANIGAIFGIGFPAWTGGPRQFLANHPDGPDAVRQRTVELEERHGARFHLVTAARS